MNKDTCPQTKTQLPLRSQIDPKRNFLLKRAEKIADVKQEGVFKALYRLHNGVLALYSSSTNPLTGDKIQKIDPSLAEFTFKIRL